MKNKCHFGNGTLEQRGRERAIEYLFDVLEIRFDIHAAYPLAARVATIIRSI